MAGYISYLFKSFHFTISLRLTSKVFIRPCKIFKTSLQLLCLLYSFFYFMHIINTPSYTPFTHSITIIVVSFYVLHTPGILLLQDLCILFLPHTPWFISLSSSSLCSNAFYHLVLHLLNVLDIFSQHVSLFNILYCIMYELSGSRQVLHESAHELKFEYKQFILEETARKTGQ